MQLEGSFQPLRGCRAEHGRLRLCSAWQCGVVSAASIRGLQTCSRIGPKSSACRPPTTATLRSSVPSSPCSQYRPLAASCPALAGSAPARGGTTGESRARGDTARLRQAWAGRGGISGPACCMAPVPRCLHQTDSCQALVPPGSTVIPSKPLNAVDSSRTTSFPEHIVPLNELQHPADGGHVWGRQGAPCPTLTLADSMRRRSFSCTSGRSAREISAMPSSCKRQHCRGGVCVCVCVERQAGCGTR